MPLKVLAAVVIGMFLASGARVCADERGDSVVVVYNSLLPESKEVAAHYASERRVPESQVHGLEMPTAEIMTRREYREELQKPLLDFLEKAGLFVFGPEVKNEKTGATVRRLQQSRIRYVVLCYGVPLRIAHDPDLTDPGEEKLPAELRRNGAAVDSELSILPWSYQKIPLNGPLRNPFFAVTNAAILNPTNGILMVARLDGPDARIAKGLVDKAIEAERDGLWGRAYFDLRGITEGALKKGDDWIGGAARIARGFGFETIIDNKPETFAAGFPMSQIALYAGWYDWNASGPFAHPPVEFMPGAFAYHLQSFSAATLRSTNKYWCGPLLAEGAAATMGCVDEPYLDGTPDINVFFGRWLLFGFTFGEAAYASQNALSWQTTIVGDPLYRPFHQTPQAQHQELLARGSKLIEWSHLRWVDINLANGGSPAEMVKYLENQQTTAHSAVLTEKLGDLYNDLGKARASISAYQRALKLDPTPRQNVRLTLKLGEKLAADGKQSEALKVYDAFMRRSPDYAGAVDLYRKMEAIAQHLGKEADAVLYATQIRRLTMGP